MPRAAAWTAPPLPPAPGAALAPGAPTPVASPAPGPAPGAGTATVTTTTPTGWRRPHWLFALLVVLVAINGVLWWEPKITAALKQHQVTTYHPTGDARYDLLLHVAAILVALLVVGMVLKALFSGLGIVSRKPLTKRLVAASIPLALAIVVGWQTELLQTVWSWFGRGYTPGPIELGDWVWSRYLWLIAFGAFFTLFINRVSEDGKKREARTLISAIAFALIPLVFIGVAKYERETTITSTPPTNQSEAIERSRVPLASEPAERHGRLQVNPDSTSTIPLYMIGRLRPVIVTYSGPFRLRCVYSNGDDMTVAGDNCPREGLALEYVINVKSEMLEIRYAYQ